MPSLADGIRFYTDAGLELTDSNDAVARLRCAGQDHESIVLIGGATSKRLHHIALRADLLEKIVGLVPSGGGTIVEAPDGFASNGLWVGDPHNMLIHLVECDADAPLTEAPPFEINAPGRAVRVRRSAMLPGSAYPPARPLRLGHILLFTPDVMASVAFITGPLGMGLADHAQDVIAFCCARQNSDHHVVAFAKSPDIGFHHASFQVSEFGSTIQGRGVGLH